MDRESVERLRFDRRLQRRRDWIEDAARQAHDEALPDVADKMTQGPDEPAEEPPASPGVADESFSSFGAPEPGTPGTPTPFGAPPRSFSDGSTESS